MKDSSNISINVGISGCKIEFKDNKVIKSTSKDYYPRLLKQAQKQHLFSKQFKFTLISSPNILDIGPNSFTMDRINGLGWEEYLKNCSISQINNLESILVEYLNFFAKQGVLKDYSSQIKGKLNSLYHNSKHKNFIKFLIKEISNPLLLNSSFCHGDLSFLNILFMPKTLVFIDFLDSFVDSYIIDIIKLRQDCQYQFCMKYSDIKSVRISRIFNKINENLEEKFKKEINSKPFQILEALNFLRIEPYAPKEKTLIIDKILKQTPIYKKYLEKY